MRVGGNIQIEGEVSKNLIEKLETYQDIMMKWYPELHRAEIFPQNIYDDLVLYPALQEGWMLFTH